MAAADKPDSERVLKFLDSLPEDVRENVKALRGVQAECDVVRKDFMKESKLLEEKYRLIYEPLFKKRAHLVMGAEQPPAEGSGAVPGFWLRVLKKAESVTDHVTRRDEPILKNLMDIRCEVIEGSPGFKLVFEFSPNPYLQTLVLEKKYFMDDNDESILERTEGTEITWSEGKNPTVKVVERKSKDTGKLESKVIQKHSFFDFFTPPKYIKGEEGEADPGQLAEIAELLAEDDFEMGCYIKEVLIPSAVSIYTGEDDDDDDEEEEEDNDDDEEEDESSDGDSDSDSD